MRKRWRLAVMTAMSAAILLAALVTTVAQQEQPVTLQATAVEFASGGKLYGRILLNEKPVVLIRAAASGVSPMRRAEIVADRLNEAFAAGSSPSDFVVVRVASGWTIMAKGSNIITATSADAKAAGVSAANVARSWRNAIAARMSFLTGQPTTIAAASATRTRQPARADTTVAVPTGKKIVPIISLGQGLHIGAAQVVGPRFRVDEVRAVAQVEAEFRRLSGTRIRALVPISTERIVSNLKRVDQVAVSMYGDIALRL